MALECRQKLRRKTRANHSKLVLDLKAARVENKVLEAVKVADNKVEINSFFLFHFINA